MHFPRNTGKQAASVAGDFYSGLYESPPPYLRSLSPQVVGGGAGIQAFFLVGNDSSEAGACRYAP
jgi:hypothetical protein